MIAHRIQPNVLEEKRLDPYYYSPEFLAHTDFMQSRFKQRIRIDDLFKVLDGTHDSVVTKSVADDYFCIPFLRAQDIGSCILNSHKGAFLSIKDHISKCKRSQIKYGDILLNIMASTGDSCFYHEGYPSSANANRAVGILRRKTDIVNSFQSRYICTILSSNIGKKELERNLKGSIQRRINLEDITETLIPYINSTAQTYIGNKVEHAEYLQNKERIHERRFFNRIYKTYPDIFCTPISGKHSRADSTEITRHLNPGAFNPERIRLQEYILSHGGKLFSELASIKAPITDNYNPDTPFFGLDAIDSSSFRLSPTTVSKAEVTGTCRLLQEGPVISKLRPYLNKVGYIPIEFTGSVGSTELLNIIPNPGISGWYLYGVLKLESTIRQLDPVSTGSTHPRISKEDIKEVYLPWSNKIESAADVLETAQLAYFSSERLTTAAKLLVEALIEGQITESELIVAQKALEAGDREADREILGRLTRKGMDLPGEPPLFPDLDGLFAALDALDTPEDGE